MIDKTLKYKTFIFLLITILAVSVDAQEMYPTRLKTLRGESSPQPLAVLAARDQSNNDDN